MPGGIYDIEEAEKFIKGLKRSDNWVSDDVLLQKLNQSLDLIQKHKREDLLPYAGVNLCLYHLDIGEYGKAWEYAGMARDYAEKQENYEKLLDSISLQYRTQRFLGNLEIAQQLINEQIEVAYKYNDAHQLASAYHNQGALFHRQRLKTEAMVAYERSIDYMLKTGDTYYIAYFNLGYGSVLLDFEELETAEKYLKTGFDLAKENQFSLPMALGLSSFGLLYQLKKNEKNCIQSFKKCIQLFRKINNVTDEVSAKIMLADAYLSFHHPFHAEKLLRETIGFCEKNNLRYNLTGIYETLSNLCEKQERYQEALESLRKLMQVKQEFLNAESDKRIRNLEMQQRFNILQIEKQNAEQLANIKHDFLANMSHEIRTPINSILGICYLLEQRPLDPLQLDYVHRLKRSGDNLLGIVNDVLDISKIESGKMELSVQPFDLSEVIKDVFQSLEPKAREKNIDFSVINYAKKNLHVLGDRVRIYQVILNLAANAIKFTNQGSVILTINAEKAQDNLLRVEFEIKDTGIGIAKSKIDRIFERYEQASAEIKNTFGGTGLGLSISKKLIELMHGTLAVKSRLNKGSTFMVNIPFQQSEMNKKLPSSNELDPSKLDKKVVLIADDNEENRLVAKEILLNFNPTIRILEVENGQQVLDKLNSIIPDIIFMDLDMPVINGIETTRTIRKKSMWKNIRIICNTASLVTISPEEIQAIGFDHFLYKPYKVVDFLKFCIE